MIGCEDAQALTIFPILPILAVDFGTTAVKPLNSTQESAGDRLEFSPPEPNNHPQMRQEPETWDSLNQLALQRFSSKDTVIFRYTKTRTG